MEKVLFIVDSTVDLTSEMYKENNLYIVPPHVHIAGKEYDDDPKQLTTKRLYEIMDETKEFPKTGAATPSQFMEAYKYAEKEGYDAVIFTGIGSTMSGTVQNATMAKDDFKGKLKIYIVDSRNLSTGTGLLVMYGLDYVRAGHTAEETAKYMETLVPRVRAQFIVHNLDIIYRGGRISSAKYLFGKMLRAHPFIQVVNGVMQVSATPKGKYIKALDYQYNVFLQDKEKGILEDHVFITHAIGDEHAEYYYDKMKDMFKKESLHVTPVGCVIGSHCGPGTIGILYVMKE
jgi:DegV family protein with EDD domain